MRPLTLPIYSDKRSWRAWRTELHSATMRSLRSSRVHEESAMRAAPLIMLSRRSSKEGRKRSSLNARGSTMICFWKKKRSREEITTAGKNKTTSHRVILISRSPKPKRKIQLARGSPSDRPTNQLEKNVLSHLFMQWRSKLDSGLFCSHLPHRFIENKLYKHLSRPL